MDLMDNALGDFVRARRRPLSLKSDEFRSM